MRKLFRLPRHLHHSRWHLTEYLHRGCHEQMRLCRFRYFLLFVCVCTLTYAGCKPHEQQPERKAEDRVMEGTIVVMGDSLTAGLGVSLEESLPYLLEEKLHTSGYFYRVVNAGVSGETSRGALSRLNWVLTMKPDILLLETGANDGLRGLPAEHLKENLLSIIERLDNEKIITVLAGMRMVSNLGDDYTKKFEAVYGEVAVDTGVIFMPFFLEGVVSHPELNREDGIHPNAKGYRVIAEHVYPYIVQAIEKRE